MASERSFPESGPWRMIETDERGTTYTPRNPTKLPRYERRLPSGECLIHDVHAGLVVNSQWYARADLDRLEPIGKPLKDRGIMKRQQENLPYFVFEYQELYDAEDRLTSRVLRLVTVHQGRQVLHQVEPPTEAIDVDAEKA